MKKRKKALTIMHDDTAEDKESTYDDKDSEDEED